MCANPSFLSAQVLGLDLRSSGFYSVLPWMTMAVSGAACCSRDHRRVFMCRLTFCTHALAKGPLSW